MGCAESTIEQETNEDIEKVLLLEAGENAATQKVLLLGAGKDDCVVL